MRGITTGCDRGHRGKAAKSFWFDFPSSRLLGTGSVPDNLPSRQGPLLTTGDRWLQETRVAKLDALPPRVHQVTSGQVSESPPPCQALKRAMILRATSSIACCTSGEILAPGSNRRPFP